LANEGDTADITSAVVPAMLCSPPVCRYLSLSIIALTMAAISRIYSKPWA